MKKNTLQSGFTLVELMVSISIFTIVVVAVIGSVYTANASARKVQATETVLNNVNFAMGAMVRTIRTGTIISCSDAINLPVDTSGEDNCNVTDRTSGSIVVRNTLGRESYVKYYWDSDTDSIKKTELFITNGVVASQWSEPVALTAPSVSVTKSRFNFIGLDIANEYQRGVSIVISGFAKTDKDSTPFSVQTFVSQRNFQ